MMRLLGFTALLAFCSVQALSVPDVSLESRAWSVYDQEHGQYSMAVMSAESSVLRYRIYVLMLEVSHTTKYIDQEIIALFNQTGTDPAKIAALESEFTNRGTTVNNNLQRIMDDLVSLSTVTGMVNDDIASSKYADIPADKTMLTNQYTNFNQLYELRMQNCVLAAGLVRNRITLTIGTQTGPEIDEIMALTDEAEALLTTHMKRCSDAKVYLDDAYTVGNAALAQLVATSP